MKIMFAFLAVILLFGSINCTQKAFTFSYEDYLNNVKDQNSGFSYEEYLNYVNSQSKPVKFSY
jgi:HKD family nuclease